MTNTTVTGTPAPVSQPVSANRTPTPAAQRSTYSTTTRTAADPTATPAASRSTSVSRNSVSANQKSTVKSTEDAEDDTGGWNFEGAVYEEDTGDGSFEGEGSTEAEEVVEAIKELLEEAQTDTKPQKKSLPPLGTGAAGGFLGAAALEGGRYLLNKRKGRKDL